MGMIIPLLVHSVIVSTETIDQYQNIPLYHYPIQTTYAEERTIHREDRVKRAIYK